jgi:hypothetical protein
MVAARLGPSQKRQGFSPALLYTSNITRASATVQLVAPVDSPTVSFLAHRSFTELFQVEVGHVGAVHDLGQGK